MALRKIKLYGKLGQKFGREWNLDVNSVGEAIHAIDINTKGEFTKFLIGKNNKISYYKISVKKKNNLISKEELCGSFGSGDIYISPVIKGSGKYGQIIAGVVLIAASYYMGGFNSGMATSWQAFVGKMGIALVLGGVAQLLMNSKSETTDQRNSYLFQGNSSTVYQGTSVGLAYGRILVSPMPVCISTDTLNIDSYQGEIFYSGPIGPVTELLYSYRGGTAILCGFDEYTDISTPPKKYRTQTWSGDVYSICLPGWNYSATWTGTENYDANCNFTDNTNGCNSWPENNFTCDWFVDFWPYGYYNESLNRTYRIKNAAGIIGYPDASNCPLNGYKRTDLSDEDTESDAINRLLNSVSWSNWQSTPVSPFYYRNITNFNISYQEVRIKTNTVDKFNPGLTYKYNYKIQRRAYGSSDPWVDAETISGTKKPNSSGDIEIDLPPDISGYESQAVDLNISY